MNATFILFISTHNIEIVPEFLLPEPSLYKISIQTSVEWIINSNHLLSI